MSRNQSSSPFELAQIAILLASQKGSGSPCDFFSEARKLLRQAADFVEKEDDERVRDFMQQSGIRFADILASNDKNNSAEKKLLPGIATEEGLIKLIRRYYAQRAIRLTAKEQKAIKDRTGQTLTAIQDQTGEDFISGKFLPRAVLFRIQEWRHAQRVKKARKPQSTVDKNL